MQLNLANASKPIEVIPLGINWWGYKVYVAKSGLKLVDNGDGLHSLTDNDDVDNAKLMTRATTVCETNTPLVLSLIDVVLERYRELWNVDMLQPDADEANNIDPEGFVQTVNANFAAENPDAAETIEERNDSLFTVADLEATKVKFEIELNLLDLCKKVNWDVLNMFFNHEHEANRVAASSNSDYKQYITSRETALAVAELC